MGKILTPEQRQELQNDLRREDKRKYADRIRVILLLDQGETYANIAKFLFLDEGTIANYKRRYEVGGLEGLIIDEYWGRKSFLTEEEKRKLTTHLEGKIYTSVAGIIAYIHKTFGVEYKTSGVTELLHSLDFSYKKPKSVPCKAKKADQEKFIGEISDLDGEIFFGDSVHPQHNPILGYGWIKKGEDVEIPSNTGRDHLNINGAINVKTKEVIVESTKTVNADAICALLRAIREKNSHKKIILILDNARYNHAKIVKKLAKLLRIKLVYLPPYSPNLNPIERLWKFFKKKVVYNTYYESLDVFEKASLKFFKNIARYRKELSTLITTNFHAVGT